MNSNTASEHQELRIKVAELCGWTHLRFAFGTLWGFKGNDDRWSPGCCGDTPNVPNYPNDLDAMHEAEKMLPDYRIYTGYLVDLVPQFAIHASAYQRALAFVKVFGEAACVPSKDSLE